MPTRRSIPELEFPVRATFRIETYVFADRSSEPAEPPRCRGGRLIMMIYRLLDRRARRSWGCSLLPAAVVAQDPPPQAPEPGARAGVRA